MNQLNDTSQSGKGKRNKGIWILVIMLVLFGGPYLASYIFMANQQLLETMTRSNRGELITPVRPAVTQELTLMDGRTIDESSYIGNWTLITVAPSNCIDDCRDTLISLRQIRRALGVNRRLVRRLVVVTDRDRLDVLQQDSDLYSGVEFVVGPDQAVANMLEWLRVPSSPQQLVVYIVDLQGNLMMYYKPPIDPDDVLTDMERLLKVFGGD